VYVNICLYYYINTVTCCKCDGMTGGRAINELLAFSTRAVFRGVRKNLSLLASAPRKIVASAPGFSAHFVPKTISVLYTKYGICISFYTAGLQYTHFMYSGRANHSSGKPYTTILIRIGTYITVCITRDGIAFILLYIAHYYRDPHVSRDKSRFSSAKLYAVETVTHVMINTHT